MSRFVFLVVFLVVGVSITYYLMIPEEKMLKVINPIDLDPQMVDESLLMDRKGYGHTIGEFSFLNQNGETITQQQTDGKVYVAEYFFTTCGSICPIMNEQMQRIQKVYLREQDLKILSFTVYPEVDTVEQMKRYALEHEANDGQWHFLTGNKADLYSLARKSFFVLKPAEAENLGDANSDFIHTNNFVLVDRKRRIRGYYDGTSTASVDSLIYDIGRLLKEE
ncbi:MAG: SCO family protein [Crocinitomicaceae bacterium]|nr:SCO family protein [Crocinitomicaceae bacterium]